MSFSCTLHPIDSRLIGCLRGQIQGERTEWDFFRRLWHKKQRINRINQPFKDGLNERLADCPDYETELHLWGRPFFITVAEPKEVTAKLDELYSLVKERDITLFYLEELRRISEMVYWERFDFTPDKLHEPDLGLNSALKKLREFYRKRKFEELGIELGFIMAQLAAAAYPYWYMDGHGLTFLEQLEVPHWKERPGGLREPFENLGETVQYIPDRLNRSLSNGMYLTPHEVEKLLEIIRIDEPEIRSKLTQKQFSVRFITLFICKITEALTYAHTHHYGLLEATDIFEKFPKRYP